MSHITFELSAYIPNTPEDILDKMEDALSITATSEGMVIITRESIENFLKDYEKFQAASSVRVRALKNFLETSLNSIKSLTPNLGYIHHIFFVS